MAITNGYCTLAEVKAAARITDSTDDVLLENCIEAASRRIDGYVGEQFYQTTSTLKIYIRDMTYNTQGYNQYIVKLPSPLVSVTTLQTDPLGDKSFSETWTAGTDYELNPLNTALQNRPYRKVVAVGAKIFSTVAVPPLPTLKINGVWGWPAIPDDVREACIIMSLRLFSRYNAPLGVLGFGEMGSVSVRAVDPDVRDMLSPYRVIGMA